MPNYIQLNCKKTGNPATFQDIDNTLCKALNVPCDEKQYLWFSQVYTKNFAPKVIIDFAQPFYFERQVIKEKDQLKLSFPGMTLSAFNTKEVIEKFKALKGIVKDVTVFYKKTPSPRVVLLVTFLKQL